MESKKNRCSSSVTLPHPTPPPRKTFFFLTYFLHLKSQITSVLGMFSNLGQDLRIARGTTFALNSFQEIATVLLQFQKKKQKENASKIAAVDIRLRPASWDATEALFFDSLPTVCPNWTPYQK